MYANSGAYQSKHMKVKKNAIRTEHTMQIYRAVVFIIIYQATKRHLNNS